MDVSNKVFEINSKFATDIDGRLKELINLWDSLNEPKQENTNSFLIISKIVTIYLRKSDYINAWNWAQNALLYTDNHNISGESEFLLGKIAFEMNNLEESKKYFKIAKNKSGTRLFRNEKKEYLEIIK